MIGTVQIAQRTLSPLFFPGLAQWYIASRMDAGNNFIDQSGNGNTGTNANVTIVASVVNGRPVARYNGTTSRTTFTSITSTTSFSVFAVIKTTNATTGAGLILWVNGAATAQIMVVNGGVNFSCFDNTNHPTSSVIDDYSAFTVVGVICTAGTCVFYQNGASIGTGAGSLNSIAVTNFGASTSFFSTTFDCAEMSFHTASLGTPQLAEITQYYRGKYNI